MTAAPPMPMGVRSADAVELRLGLDFPTLTAAYCRWRAEELFPLIFHRCPDIGLMDWLDWNYSSTVEPVGCFVGDRLVGVGWICQAYRTADGSALAEVGAAFFKGTPISVWHRALDLFLHHAFVDRGYSIIYGLSSKNNPYAMEILRYCGMTPADSLPWGQEIPSDTMAYRLARKDWRGLQ